MSNEQSHRYILTDSVVLEECPDTVEKVPDEKSNTFICGTYELLEQTSESTPAHLMNRKGSVYLFSVENGKLKQHSVIATEAILDSKWRSAKNENHMFGTADAVGAVNIYKLSSGDATDGTYHMSMISSISAVEEGLALSIDWSVNGSSIACSGSNGSLSINSLSPSSTQQVCSWHAHDAEVWITSHDIWDENILYSGADDCKFRGWDLRSKKPTFTNSSHDAGVCSLQCNPLSPHTIASGSYDEKVRIWDTRSIRRSPQCEVNAKGGVWRIKWHKQRKDMMVVASMYGGFDVFDFTNIGNPVSNTSFNVANGSLGYGVDWLYDDAESIASCTFYDKKLFVGTLEKC